MKFWSNNQNIIQQTLFKSALILSFLSLINWQPERRLMLISIIKVVEVAANTDMTYTHKALIYFNSWAMELHSLKNC